MSFVLPHLPVFQNQARELMARLAKSSTQCKSPQHDLNTAQKEFDIKKLENIAKLVHQNESTQANPTCTVVRDIQASSPSQPHSPEVDTMISAPQHESSSASPNSTVDENIQLSSPSHLLTLEGNTMISSPSMKLHSQKDLLIPLFIIISDNFLFIFSQVH